jgi:Type II CAAX prenyl endopeptidase Rce1-like
MNTFAFESAPAPRHFRIAVLLAVLAAISTLLVLPYAVDVLPDAVTARLSEHLALFYAAQTVQSGFMFLLLAWIGLRLGHDLGLDAPLLRHALREAATPQIAMHWRAAASLGVAAGVACLLLLVVAPMPNVAGHTPVWWKGLLASFYGGIGEEIMCRLFLVSLLVWVGARVLRTTHPPAAVYTIAIVIAAVLFGVGHLPILSQISEVTPALALQVVGLNALCGITFGWVFWRYGLEHAMVSHFCADLVLHVAAPLL